MPAPRACPSPKPRPGGPALPLLAAAAALLPAVAAASEGGHQDPVGSVALWLAVILVCAKLGAHVAGACGQPAILGELVVGALLGNLSLVGVTAFEPLRSDPHIDMIARLGVLLLLFEVGLESTVPQMMKVGWSSLLVALFGVGAPMALGWLVGAWLLPDHSLYVHLFLGATLCATSVGITARVLQDLKCSTTPAARIILGAAVIDDVLGLVVLASVTAAIVAADSGQALGGADVAWILGKSLLFLLGALALGTLMSRRLFRLASRLSVKHVFLATSLSLCLLLSWLANSMGLAAIVGAFAAGLILEESHFLCFKGRGERELGELISPISAFLVPVFFVLMGARIDCRSFMLPGVAGLAAALTGAAIVGKQACMLGVLQRGVDRVTVGLGMVPRGEVGLVFANAGLALTVAGQRIIDEALFAAVMVMVIVTTVVTPPALKWSLARRRPVAD